MRLAPATLRSWVIGRSYPKQRGTGVFKPLIRPADKTRQLLSFNNLIEAHVLRAFRTEHGVSIQALRDALRYAESELEIDRLLLRKELSTTAGDLFLERYGELVNLSKSGQLAMKKVLEACLQRVEWDTSFPVRLYPFVSTEDPGFRAIVIDPSIAFGRPVVTRNSISTASIVERIDAGEGVEDVAADYSLTREEVEEAILYERAA